MESSKDLLEVARLRYDGVVAASLRRVTAAIKKQQALLQSNERERAAFDSGDHPLLRRMVKATEPLLQPLLALGATGIADALSAPVHAAAVAMSEQLIPEQSRLRARVRELKRLRAELKRAAHEVRNPKQVDTLFAHMLDLWSFEKRMPAKAYAAVLAIVSSGHPLPPPQPRDEPLGLKSVFNAPETSIERPLSEVKEGEGEVEGDRTDEEPSAVGNAQRPPTEGAREAEAVSEGDHDEPALPPTDPHSHTVLTAELALEVGTLFADDQCGSPADDSSAANLATLQQLIEQRREREKRYQKEDAEIEQARAELQRHLDNAEHARAAYEQALRPSSGATAEQQKEAKEHMKSCAAKAEEEEKKFQAFESKIIHARQEELAKLPALAGTSTRDGPKRAQDAAGSDGVRDKAECAKGGKTKKKKGKRKGEDSARQRRKSSAKQRPPFKRTQSSQTKHATDDSGQQGKLDGSGVPGVAFGPLKSLETMREWSAVVGDSMLDELEGDAVAGESQRSPLVLPHAAGASGTQRGRRSPSPPRRNAAGVERAVISESRSVPALGIVERDELNRSLTTAELSIAHQLKRHQIGKPSPLLSKPLRTDPTKLRSPGLTEAWRKPSEWRSERMEEEVRPVRVRPRVTALPPPPKQKRRKKKPESISMIIVRV